MEIIIGKTAGFCFGVQNAVEKTIKELEKNNSIYCLGELVHNRQVTEMLIKKGAKFIEDIEEAKNRVIIRAHGVPKETYMKAKKLNLEVIDLTCPKVMQIHNIVEKYAQEDYFIIITGDYKHPEVIGIVGFCNENNCVIKDENEIQIAIEKFQKSNKKNILLISQTTYSVDKFEKVANNLKNTIDSDSLTIKNTICSATKNRQEETENISKQVRLMIIVGSKHSSNTIKLYEIAKRNCSNTLFIESAEEIEQNMIENIEKVGIMAGASAPKTNIEQIVEKINKIC